MSSPLSIVDGGAKAILTDWDGHIAVERLPISLVYTVSHESQSQSQSPLPPPSDDRSNTSNLSIAESAGTNTPFRPYSCTSRRRTLTFNSSALSDSLTEVEDLQSEHEPTSAILDYCKRKFLQPYLAILSIVGLNPNANDLPYSLRACLSYTQTLLVLFVLILGYFLQYLCSYRGDRGFANCHRIIPNVTLNDDYDDAGDDSCEHSVRTIGELLFGYIVPSSLHLMGFLSAVYAKMNDREQLQNLVERVFLMSMKPQRLCRGLWMYVFSGFALLILLIAYVIPSVLMQDHIIQVRWLAETFKHNWQTTSKVSLLITIFVQDLVEVITLSSYCIECYLLRMHLSTLSQKLLLHSIESLDWMREVLEFRKLLDHLNHRIALPICFFTVMNLTFAFAGLVYLFDDFDFHYSAMKLVLFNITNVLLWLFMGLLPFFMAASVTRVCQNAQANGHHIRVRPFVYQNTSAEDLNSTLLFASSLDMSAKLFRMPIQPNYLCFAIMIVTIVVLTLGMCVNLTSLGTI